MNERFETVAYNNNDVPTYELRYTAHGPGAGIYRTLHFAA